MRLGRVSGAEALMRLLKLTPRLLLALDLLIGMMGASKCAAQWPGEYNDARLLPALDLLLPLLSGPCFHPGTTANVALRGRITSPPGMQVRVCGWEGLKRKRLASWGGEDCTTTKTT